MFSAGLRPRRPQVSSGVFVFRRVSDPAVFPKAFGEVSDPAVFPKAFGEGLRPRRLPNSVRRVSDPAVFRDVWRGSLTPAC